MSKPQQLLQHEEIKLDCNWSEIHQHVKYLTKMKLEFRKYKEDHNRNEFTRHF